MSDTITAAANAAGARFDEIGALIRSEECRGVSAVVARHTLPHADGFRVVLALNLTQNGGAPRLVDLTAEVAAGTWGWSLDGGCITGAGATAHEIVNTAGARLGLARGALNGFAEI